MPRCHYVSGTGGERVSLDGPLTYVGTGEGLRGRSWAYSLGARGISGVSHPAREVSVDAFFGSPEEADLLRRLADRDVALGTPGAIEVDGWSQRAYVTRSDPSAIYRGFHRAQLTVVLLDGVWRRYHEEQFIPVAGEGSEWLDLPYDLPYDLARIGTATEVEGPEWMPCPVLLRIYGHCSSPEVVIAGNSYAVDCTVPEGGHLVIDGLSRTVELVAADGTRTNAFPSARWGEGQLPFALLPTGTSHVAWDYSFGFDLGWWEEDTTPPWQTGR